MDAENDMSDQEDLAVQGSGERTEEDMTDQEKLSARRKI